MDKSKYLAMFGGWSTILSHNVHEAGYFFHRERPCETLPETNNQALGKDQTLILVS